MAADENERAEGLLEQIQRKKAERAGIVAPKGREGDLLTQVQRAKTHPAGQGLLPRDWDDPSRIRYLGPKGLREAIYGLDEPEEPVLVVRARRMGWYLKGTKARGAYGAALMGLAVAITGDENDYRLLDFHGDPRKVKSTDIVDITPLLKKAAEHAEPVTPLESLAEQAAAKYGIPPAVLKGLIRQESQWKVAARSGKGAVGLTQLMPDTARELGLKVDAQVDERLDTRKNVDAGARYLRAQYDKLYEGKTDLERWRLALAAYNWGRGHVNAHLRKIGKVGKARTAEWSEIAPDATGETRDYVRRILGESGPVSGYAKEYGYGD